MSKKKSSKAEIPKRFSVDLDPWGCTVFFQCGGEVTSFTTYLKNKLSKLDVDPEILNNSIEQIETIQADGKGRALTFWITDRDHAIWFDDPDPEMKIVIHEMLHVVIRVMGDVSIAPDGLSGEEAWCYTIADLAAKSIPKIAS